MTLNVHSVGRTLFFFALCACAFFNGSAQVKLPGLFHDHMVLQRDHPIRVWGWASPGEKVVVRLYRDSVSVKADKQGRWQAGLKALSAGGPYELMVAGTNKITLSDILIGDVWVCGGQSNMEWRIRQTDFKESDTAFIQENQVRMFTAHVAMDYLPKEDLQGGGWKILTRENIEAFSAVGYHFGKFLQQETGVPIGLISANLGATAVETWMSNEALLEFPQFESEIKPIVRANKNFDALNADFEKAGPAWYNKNYYKGVGIDEGWFRSDTDASGWKRISAAGNTWEEIPELRDHDGAVWFRKTFDLPKDYQQETFLIQLGQIDDYDITWVNGEKVGETYGKHNHRNYTVPISILKEKGNVLAVRVFDTGGIGGFTTSPFWAGQILSGAWSYRKGEAIDARKFKGPSLPNATPFSSPGVLFNGMIAPLSRFPIKGVIWYQGESNAARAYEYRALFPAMISDWRKSWDLGDFPFLFVQLANYMEEPALPGESNWAELREAQAMALSLGNTGMATAIDIGEAGDIHPRNKQAVGYRLGLSALSVAYNRKEVVSSGPSFKRMTKDGDQLRIYFEDTGGGLITKDKYGYVRGFQVAGEDRKFYWAQAFIENSDVVVRSRHVSNPVAVRYAWADNPGELDLYNKEGLPALPFRSDTWNGATEGKVFTEGPRF